MILYISCLKNKNNESNSTANGYKFNKNKD